MYDPEKITLPENFEAEHIFSYGVRNIRDEILAPYPRTEDEIRKHLADYYGMITHLDYEIGRIVESLKEKGEYENTIIILAGDNGLALGQHGLMGKQSAYEHSIRVPLIFSGPGINENKQDDAACYLLDIFPTLCDLLGFNKPDGLDGFSLIDVLKGTEVKKNRDVLYFAYADLLRSIKKEDFKLIEYAGNYGRKTQLFNLKDDPLEKNNLADKADYAEKLSDLRKELLRQKDLWDDTESDVSQKFWRAYHL